MNIKLKVTFFTSGTIAVSLIGLLFWWGDADSFMVALIGMAIGWWLGVIIAPYPAEAATFEKWSKGLFGLVSGITLTKVFDFFTKLSETHNHNLWDETVLRRAGFGLCSFLVTSLTVFVARSYANGK